MRGIIHIFLFWLLLIVSTNCNNDNKIVLKKTPSTRYEIEYKDSSITINYVIKEKKGEKPNSFTLYYNNGHYYDEDDSCVFFSLKDTTICEYDSHFNSLHIMRFRKLNKNLYATENFIVNNLSNNVLGNMERQKSIRNGIHYYYDSTYHIVGIHRYDEVDEFVLK